MEFIHRFTIDCSNNDLRVELSSMCFSDALHLRMIMDRLWFNGYPKTATWVWNLSKLQSRKNEIPGRRRDNFRFTFFWLGSDISSTPITAVNSCALEPLDFKCRRVQKWPNWSRYPVDVVILMSSVTSDTSVSQLVQVCHQQIRGCLYKHKQLNFSLFFLSWGELVWRRTF